MMCWVGPESKNSNFYQHFNSGGANLRKRGGRLLKPGNQVVAGYGYQLNLNLARGGQQQNPYYGFGQGGPPGGADGNGQGSMMPMGGMMWPQGAGMQQPPVPDQSQYGAPQGYGGGAPQPIQ